MAGSVLKRVRGRLRSTPGVSAAPPQELSCGVRARLPPCVAEPPGRRRDWLAPRLFVHGYFHGGAPALHRPPIGRLVAQLAPLGCAGHKSPDAGQLPSCAHVDAGCPSHATLRQDAGLHVSAGCDARLARRHTTQSELFRHLRAKTCMGRQMIFGWWWCRERAGREL